MPVTYPICLPLKPSTNQLVFKKQSAVSTSVAPSSFKAQSYVWPGQGWMVDATWPPGVRSRMEPLVAALSSLNGGEGSVLLRDNSNVSSQNTSLAANINRLVVNGASQTGYDLNIKNAIALQALFKAGDWIQLGGKNLLAKTQVFNDALWIKNTLTVTDNSAAAPTGTFDGTTAALCAPSGTDSYLYQYFQPPGRWGHTFSFWGKKNVSGQLGLLVRVSNNFGTTLAQSVVVLNNTSWQRFSLPFFPQDGTLCVAQIGGGSTWPTGQNCLLWGAQVDPVPYLQEYRPAVATAYSKQYELYKVINDVYSDNSGNATVTLWPKLRTSPLDGEAVTWNSALGRFALVSGDDWSIDSTDVYGMQSTFVEDQRP